MSLYRHGRQTLQGMLKTCPAMFAKHQPTTPAETKPPTEHAISFGELARWAGSYKFSFLFR
jgi:hypothetical protein